MVQEQGTQIFSSLPAIWLKQLPYTITQLVSFELFTKEGVVDVRICAIRCVSAVCDACYDDDDEDDDGGGGGGGGGAATAAAAAAATTCLCANMRP